MLAATLARAPAAPPLTGRRIAYTTPPGYATSLSALLDLAGAATLPLPTIIAEPTPHTLAALRRYLLPGALDPFSALAFTSRNAISAAAAALPSPGLHPLSPKGDTFTIAALGRDADLLHESGLLFKLSEDPHRFRILVPEIASPSGLVASLGRGDGRRVLCPAPEVVDLKEPPVIPDFIRDLEGQGWVAIKVPAYETRWAGSRCVEGLARLDAPLDAIIFTSSAEVEGLMKGLAAIGWDWAAVRKQWPEMVVAAHGPVTAKGADRWGVAVDVVSSKFSSFQGVLEALSLQWET